MRRLSQASDWAATRLALIFGFNLTIWVFFTVPLLAELFPVTVQAKVFYYASGWVQLFALPLMVYVSNKIQASSDRQDQLQTQMLEQSRRTEAENQQLLREVRALLVEHARVAEELREHIRTHIVPPPDSG
jgi:hypothetical protein